MGGIGIWQLLIVALIIVLLFGTKKLRNIGGDLGSAVKGFKKAVSPDDDQQAITDKREETTSKTETADSKNKEQV